MGAGGGGDFVTKTVAGITASLERAVFSEEQARIPALLQGLDPRAKVASALLLLVAVGLAHHLSGVIAAYLVMLLLAWSSRLPLGEFSRRVWLGVPLFAGFVAFPSIVMLPGNPLLVLWEGPPMPLVVTDNGLASALLFVARVGTSVSLALLLVATTRWTDLLGALRVLRVPESFLVVLAMTYRYLFLFLRSANNLFLARASRTVGATSGVEQRRWAATAAGTLMSRSMKMSMDVLLAMEARGFSGEIRSTHPPRMRDGDWLLLALVVVLSAGLLLLDPWLI
ncbi:MAG: cobalt ECF transporter T component CbiQ [Chloroflexota bacterium]